MKARGVIAVLAGQASIVAILVLVLVLSLAGTPLLQQKKIAAQRIGAEFALTKAQAVSETLLAKGAAAGSMGHSGESYFARHLKQALIVPPRDTAPRGFPQRAVAALKASDRARKPATVTKLPSPLVSTFSSRSLPFCAAIHLLSLILKCTLLGREAHSSKNCRHRRT